MITSSTKPTFAVLEGIGEGRLISRRFRRQVLALGWSEEPARTAAIIITHSGGIYILPAKTQARLFVHLNCTQYMPFNQLAGAHKRKIAHDLREQGSAARGLLGVLLNGLYLFNVPRDLAMRRGFNRSDEVLAALPAGRHVFICGIDDGLSDAAYLMQHAGDQQTYVSIKAGHDDCWRHPELYTSTLQLLYARVLAETDR